MRNAVAIGGVTVIWAIAACAVARIRGWYRWHPPQVTPPAPSRRPARRLSGRVVHLHCGACHAEPRIPIEDTALLRDSDGLYRVWASCTAPGCWSVITTSVVGLARAAELVAEGVTEGEALITQLVASLDEVTW
jgi:hypothetical protein